MASGFRGLLDSELQNPFLLTPSSFSDGHRQYSGSSRNRASTSPVSLSGDKKGASVVDVNGQPALAAFCFAMKLSS